nr:adenosine deaminase [Lachnospiraceae bacterium]
PEERAELSKLMRVSEDCRDLNEFLEKFVFPCSLLQTAESIKMAFKNLLNKLKDQGHMYAEIRFAPQKSMEKGLTQEEVLLAALEGVKDGPLPCGIILCCMRGNDNHEANMETVELAGKYLGKGVCAIDLAGAEALFPTKDFEDLFVLAKKKHIPFTIHAGEAAGPESIECALKFGAKRIGHGVRALEKPELVKELAKKRIPLELCPTSNLNTAIFKEYTEYPLRQLMDAGVLVTINTDDPSIEGTNIKKEYERMIKAFSLTQEEIKGLLLNSVEASFATEELKEEMRKRVESEFDNLESDCK